jgi:hypothetical protein
VWSCGLYIWIDLCEMVHSKDLKWSLNDLPWIYFLWFYLYADGLHFVSLVTNFEEYVDIDLSCVQYWEVRKWIIICLMTENIWNRFLFNSSWFGFISSIIYLNNYYLNCWCETFSIFSTLKNVLEQFFSPKIGNLCELILTRSPIHVHLLIICIHIRQFGSRTNFKKYFSNTRVCSATSKN